MMIWRFEKEKLKLKKWFTKFKNENYFPKQKIFFFFFFLFKLKANIYIKEVKDIFGICGFKILFFSLSVSFRFTNGI
jgi:hypothetical protein